MLGSLLELDQFAAYRTGPQASPGMRHACGTRPYQSDKGHYGDLGTFLVGSPLHA
jgi:hypothetical protein